MLPTSSLLKAGTATLLWVSHVLTAATIVVNSTASHPIPKTLWGQMFEDINSGDGGLYGELLQNRALQKVTPGSASATYAWHPIGGANISVVADESPLSAALPNALEVAVPADATSEVGVGNEGYWGIKVDASWTYNASFYYKIAEASSNVSSFNVTLDLRSASGTSFAATPLSLEASSNWTRVFVQLTPTVSANDTANNFTITFDGAALQGASVHFALFSLFPPTYKDRPNGMRKDIAETLAAMKPGVFRLPGGNNLEGQTVDTRWKWNETLGDLVNRPGRFGDWSYINTDGLGLYEYLLWCEDLDIEAILGVWAGYALTGDTVPETALAPYIQEAIKQIEFAVGDPAVSEPAALRAQLGHPEPFPLTYIEIGNEDFIGSAPGSYQSYRWKAFHDNISAAFPNLKIIATSRPFKPVLSPTPEHYDVHVYQTPKWFANNSFYYDGFERNGTTYFEGEYAATSTNSSDIYGLPQNGRLLWPTMEAAAGEAVFMTGLERNSDIVFAAAYAPLLNHVNNSQWTPNLVSFDAATVYPSASYYAQKLFSTNRGDEYLPSTLPAKYGTVAWGVARWKETSTIIIKLANGGGNPADLVFELSDFDNVATNGTVEVLTGPRTSANTPTTPNAIVPTTSSIALGKTFNYTAPAWSLTVLTFEAH